MTTTLSGPGTLTCTQKINYFFQGTPSISYGILNLPGQAGTYINFGSCPDIGNIDTFIDCNVYMTSSIGPQDIISNSSDNWGIRIENSTNKFQIYVNTQDNGFSTVRSLLPVTANQWYRVTGLLRYEFSQYILHLYIDGVQQGDAVLTAHPRFTGLPSLLVGGTGGTSAQIQDIQFIQGQNMEHDTPLVVPTGTKILSLAEEYLQIIKI